MKLNYEVLDETKKEIGEMYFWKEKIDLNPLKYIVIHDIERAYENAFEAFFDYEGKEGFSWDDILEENMAKLWKPVFESDNSTSLIKEINELRIPSMYIDSDTDSDIVDEMAYELMLCAKSRFICGKENAFFEQVFNVFKLGGWPCGWDDGKIIVYFPKNNYN